MFGMKRFDLRVKDMISVFRNSYVGATASYSEKDMKHEKALLFILIASVAIITLISYLVSTL